MSESEPSARPRQLIVAGGFVIAASVIMLLSVFDAVSNLQSVETRDTVIEFLSTPLGESLGLSTAQVLSVTRVALMVTGLCAAASLVLGVFVFQRHHGARIALSIVAVPILVASLVTAPLTGVLLGALIAGATVALWTGAAGDWFAGRPIRQPVAPTRRSPDDRPGAFGGQAGRNSGTDSGNEPGPYPGNDPDRGPGGDSRGPGDATGAGSSPGPPVSQLSTQRPSTQPTATSGFGERPVLQDPAQPLSPGGPPWGAAPERAEVPAGVKVACLLTWLFSGVVALVYAVLVVVLIVASDQLVDLLVESPEWQRTELESDLILPVLWVGCLMFLAWSGGALVLAWFTWRRHNWARYLLAASAGAALIGAAFAFPVGLLHQVACALTIAGLFSVRSRTWFDTRNRYGPPPGPPPGPPYGPPQGPPHGPPPGQGWGQGPGQGPPSGPSGPNGQDKPPVW